MRAFIHDRYGGPVTLQTLPEPVPGEGELLVAVLTCGVNLSDWECLVGSPAYARLGGLLKPSGRPLGSDIVGRVLALGPGVTGFSVGERVFADVVMRGGGFAERTTLPAALCAPVPEGLSDEVAACLPQPGPIADQGTARVSAGMRVLINGAGGGSGTLALQLAKAAGAHVTAVDNAGKVDWLRELGADATLDYTRQDFAARGGAAQAPWDHILDMVATRGPLRASRALDRGGWYRAVGGPVRTILPLALFGPLLRPFTGRDVGMLAVATGREQTLAIAERVAAGALSPVVDSVLPFDAVPEALRRVGAGEARGKVVVRVA